MGFGIGILIAGGKLLGRGTQHIDFNSGFTLRNFTEIFGEDFGGGGQGHCDPLMVWSVFRIFVVLCM